MGFAGDARCLHHFEQLTELGRQFIDVLRSRHRVLCAARTDLAQLVGTVPETLEVLILGDAHRVPDRGMRGWIIGQMLQLFPQHIDPCAIHGIGRDISGVRAAPAAMEEAI